MSDMLAVLKKLVDDIDSAELIGGECPSKIAPLVDLDIAYSPVVSDRHADPYFQHIPKPDVVHKQSDGRYRIDWPEHGDFRFYSADEIKVMRARYLLLRGYYYGELQAMAYSTRQQVLARFFPGGVWQPDAKSELGKAMGLNGG